MLRPACVQALLDGVQPVFLQFGFLASGQTRLVREETPKKIGHVKSLGIIIPKYGWKKTGNQSGKQNLRSTVAPDYHSTYHSSTGHDRFGWKASSKGVPTSGFRLGII